MEDDKAFHFAVRGEVDYSTVSPSAIHQCLLRGHSLTCMCNIYRYSYKA